MGQKVAGDGDKIEEKATIMLQDISLTEGRWLDLDSNKDSKQHEEEAKEINEEQDGMGNNKDDKALKNNDALLRFKFQVELLELPVPVDHDKLDVMVLAFILSS